jgi:hypothetical protein
MTMQMETEMLLEAWQKLVEFIPAKDKLDAARSYVSLIDDYCSDETQIQEIKDADNLLEAALNEYYQDDHDDFDDEELEEY